MEETTVTTEKPTNLLISLPPDEAAKATPLSDEAIRQALKMGEADRDAAQAYAQTSRFNSNIMFR